VVFFAMQIVDLRQPATKPQRRGRSTVGRRQDDETHTAVDRKDAAAIVEAHPRIDGRPIEELPAERRAAVIGGDARRGESCRCARRFSSAARRDRERADSCSDARFV
jgi:hypothetical protein